MKTCPYCDGPLEPKHIADNLCPHCESVLVPLRSPQDGGDPSDGGESDESNAGEDQGQKTVDDFRHDQTVDFDALGAKVPPHDEEDQGQKTVDDVRHDQTVDFDGGPPDQGEKTVDDVHHQGTVDFDPDSSASGGPGTVGDAGMATMDSAEWAEQQTRQMDDLWGEAVKPGIEPGMTIKGRDAGGGGPENSLVIQSRALREEQDSNALGADYQLISVLGTGGMGVVYTARQASIDRTVAIKMLKSGGRGDDGQRAKFLSEAVVTGDLDHPNIVPIYDLGSNEQGALFYSMKKVEGTPWDRVIGHKSLADNVDILMKVADAVDFAHSRGVIHRDLKPENVMLGEFGEVLVMDWGLALPTGKFRKSGSVSGSAGVGGTPAYMAPEMATGRVEEISQSSDIYLLGAILFEIVTGRPPHTGKNTMKCLYAAARNEIQPAESRDDELMNIALKAMATSPADRYADVKEFKAAIRDYLSHIESVVLCSRAEQELQQARETNDYQDFSRALFAFQEAFALWEGNARAQQGIAAASLAYAASAYKKGDYDLGESLLDLDDPGQLQLHDKIVSAKREREARQQRLKTFKRLMVAGVAVFLVVVSGAAVWINFERAEAVRQREIAKLNEQEALKQKGIAESNLNRAIEGERLAKENEMEAIKQKGIAEANLIKAVEQELLAKKNEMEAVKQKGIAETNLKKAIEQEMLAKKNEMEAVKQKGIAETNLKKAIEQEMLAKKNEKEAVRQKGLAETNLKKAVEQELLAKKNAMEAVRQKGIAEDNAKIAQANEKKAVEAKEAEEYEAYIARIGLAAAKIEENAYGHARELLVGCHERFRSWEWGRLMFLCNQSVRSFDTGDRAEAVAFSRDGKYVATGSWNTGAKVWDAGTGQMIAHLPLPGRYVHAVEFSRDGQRVAVGANDQLIRIWNIQTHKVEQTLAGHGESVLAVSFSADGRRLLSCSYDKTARLWDLTTGKQIRSFVGHNWWVWDAAFSPDEQRIVTASQDRTVIVWSAENGRRLAQFMGHEGPVYTAAFSPDGKHVVSAGYDKRLLVWRPEEALPYDYKKVALGAPLPEAKYRTIAGHKSAVRSLDFHTRNDQMLLISGGHDNAVNYWHFATGTLLKSMRGHDSWVRCCRFSPDGDWIVSAGYDHTARLWNIEGYEEVRILRGRVLDGHEDALLAADFSPRGEAIVTASRDRTAKTWSFQTGQELRTFEEGHSFLASRAVFYAGGKRLVTAAVDNTARVWDVASGAQLRIFRRTGRSAAVAVSHDVGGKNPLWLLTGGDNATAQILDLTTGKVIKTLQQGADVTAVAISPDNRLLAIGDAGGKCKLWDAATGRVLKTLSGHTRRIRDIEFLPGGTRLLTASSDNTVAQWDVRSGRELNSLLMRHPDSVYSLAVSADGQTAITSCRDGKARVWDARTGRLQGLLNSRGIVNHVAISPDGRQALTASTEEQLVRLWDVGQRREITRPDEDGRAGHFLNLKSRGGLVWAVAYSPEGRHALTVGGADARLWELATARQRMSFSPNGAVAAAAFSPGGAHVVTASWDSSAKIWDAKSGQAVQKLLGHRGFVNSAVFSSDGAQVLTASDDATAILWDVKSGQPQVTYRGHALSVRSAVFSADGTRVLTASDDQTARVWETATGKQLARLDGDSAGEKKGHAFGLLEARFSPDGRRVVTASADNTARIWDVASGKVLQTLAGHTAGVTSAVFSPDNRRVITASQDQTVILWDATLGREAKEILTLKGHTGEVASVRFSSDGRHVLTASHDGTAMLWLAEPWKQDAREVAARSSK